VREVIDNCRLEREDRAFLVAQQDMPKAFRAFGRPAEVSTGWHKDENQGYLGSCQGNDLTSCLERLQKVQGKTPEQLSRIFAYIATQKTDGLIGADQGSTISGGAKLALQYGVCPESMTGYPNAYPDAAARSKILSPANYQAGAPYKAKSTCAATEEPDDAMDFIGGGGAWSLGMLWWRGMIPADRVVRKYAPPAGTRSGHAIAVLGYTKDGLLIPINSHGDGEFYFTPEAWRQVMRHPYTACIGLMGNEGAPVDWMSESYMDQRTKK
jgi:hypothetical protein